MEKIKGMDLQLFANDGEETENEEDVNLDDVNVDTEDVDVETDEQDKLDLLDLLDKDEEIKKQFQAEVDRSITRALQTRDKKHQEELKRQEQRANMTAEELQAEKERELAEREAEIQQYELRLKKVDYFKENNIDLALLDYIVVEDAEQLEDKTKGLMDVIDSVVEKKVAAKLKENGYELGDTEEPVGVSLKDLSNMSTDEINSMWEDIV